MRYLPAFLLLALSSVEGLALKSVEGLTGSPLAGRPDANARPHGLEPRTAEAVAELAGAGRRLYSLAVSPDGRHVAAAGAEPTLRIWATLTGRLVRSIEAGTGQVLQVGFSGDGRHVLALSGNERALKVFGLSDGSEVCSVRNVRGNMQRTAASPDGKTFAVGSPDGTCRIYEIPSGAEVRALQDGGTRGTPLALAYSKDGKQVAAVKSSGQQGTLRIWDPANGSQLMSPTEEAEQMYGLAFSPGGKQIVTVGAAGSAKVRDARSGAVLRTLAGHTGNVYSVDWSPDGRWIATGGQDGSVRVWDAVQGTEVRKLDAHSGLVCSLAFTPDGRKLVTAGYDGKIKIWGAKPMARAATPAAGPPGTGYIGIAGSDAPGGGVQISLIMEDGAAERFGLEVGDVITEFKGTTISTYGELVTEVRKCGEGEEVKIKYKRAGVEKELKIKLGLRPQE